LFTTRGRAVADGRRGAAIRGQLGYPSGSCGELRKCTTSYQPPALPPFTSSDVHVERPAGGSLEDRVRTCSSRNG